MNVFTLMANLDLDNRQFDRNLNQAEKRGRNFAGRVGGAARVAGKAALGLTGLLAGAGAAAFAAGGKLGNYADGILDAAEQTGLSTEAIQEFRAVAREAGVSSDAMNNAAERLTNRLGPLDQMSKRTKDAFEALGVQTHNADGSLRSMDDIMPEVIGSLGDMENTTERNSTAAAIFGRGYAELMPVVALGAEGFAEARDRAHEMGDVMSEDSLNSANDLRVGMEEVQASLGNIGREVLQEFIPVLNGIVSWVQQHMPAIREGVAAAMEGISQVWNDVLKPAFEAVRPLIENVILPVLGSLVENGFTVVKGIVETLGALLRGDFAGAWEGLKTILSGVVGYVRDVLNAVWGGAIQVITGAISGFAEAATGVFNAIWDAIKSLPEKALTLAGNMLSKLRQGISNSLERLRSSAGTVFTAIWGAVSALPSRALELAGNFISQMRSGIEAALHNLRTIAGDIVSTIMEAIGDLPGAMLEMGRNVVAGLVDGMRGALDSVGEAASGLWARLTGTFEEEAEIESPSRRFAMHGQNIVAGLAGGIDDAAPMVDRSMTNLLDRLDELTTRRDFLLDRFLSILAPSGFGANVNALTRMMVEGQLEDVNAEITRLARTRDASTAPRAAPQATTASFTPQQPYWQDRETVNSFRRATNKFSDDVRRLTLANLRY